jgi:hypothetical protein
MLQDRIEWGEVSSRYPKKPLHPLRAAVLPWREMAGTSSTLGYDLSAVSAHPGAGAASKAVGAAAYTGGSDMNFGAGQYGAGAAGGQALMGHELSHVVQQRAPAKPADIQAAVGHYAR